MKRRIAYPTALVLVVLGSYVGMAYGVAGTMNGATILAVLLIAAAFYVAGKARRDDENPVADEPVKPNRKPTIFWVSKPVEEIDPKRFGDAIADDLVFLVSPDSSVAAAWVFDGEHWQEKAL